MEKISLENELKNNSYPGRGIIIGRSADGKMCIRDRSGNDESGS